MRVIQTAEAYKGGPGGSGVQQILGVGRSIQTIIDFEIDPSTDQALSSDTAKYFDVIGFDPRGVNNTTPNLICFPDTLTRYAWRLQSEANGILGSSEESFMTNWARSKAVGGGCSQMTAKDDEGEEDLRAFMNTPAVVADMVEIIERYGEWRENHANEDLQGIAANVAGRPQLTVSLTQSVGAWTKWRKGEEKLMYWGFSYGSVLGATFAAMQPHRVERVVIDGVVDAADFYRGEWLTNIQDADSVMGKFYEYCHKAGPESCRLHTGESSEGIKVLVESIIANIKRKPVPVQASNARGPDIITYGDIKRLIGDALYKPLGKFARMAQMLADISHGNGSALADLKSEERTPPRPPFDFCKSLHNPHHCELKDFEYSDVSSAIICTDGESISGWTPEDFKPYLKLLQKQSETIGSLWASIRMSCAGWNIRPKWKFAG